MHTAVSGKAPMHPLLAKYLVQLATNPLRTKALTSGTFSFLQEVIGSNVAGLAPAPVSKDATPLAKALARARIDSRAFKMALYGSLVSAPLSHFLVGLLQKAFAGKTGFKARLAQLLASNLLIAPIQTTAFITCMAVISGVKSLDEVVRTIKGSFFSVIRVTWVISPISMTIAQQFVPVDLWVPFFSVIQFALGTILNIKFKQAKLAATRKEAEKRERENARQSAAE